MVVYSYRPAADANGPVLNGGDYYILEATNPADVTREDGE